MVIYEVNLCIDEEIYAEYLVWLKEHVQKMLQFPGFLQASFFKPEQECNAAQEKLTVQYQLESRDALEKYFTEFAPKMREDGIRRFGNKFSAERRIFHVQAVILKYYT